MVNKFFCLNLEEAGLWIGSLNVVLQIISVIKLEVPLYMILDPINYPVFILFELNMLACVAVIIGTIKVNELSEKRIDSNYY